MSSRVLVVDDDPELVACCGEILRARGVRMSRSYDASAASTEAEGDDVVAMLVDLGADPDARLSILERVAGVRPGLPVIALAREPSVESATRAMRAGAFDFLAKPIDPARLAESLERAVASRAPTPDGTRDDDAGMPDGLHALLGESPAMNRLRDVIVRVAPTLATVLVTGESGTGKERVARAIHALSPHRDGPFVAINCAAVPGELLESELFGHERGAFTDAKSTRRGLFVEAQGGTLLLDEIGEMPIAMQVKLLRALQERTVRPVGSNSENPFDARVIAATNRDLELDVREKRFREDLYYRIHVCTVDVPPLREREGDVAVLARAFVPRFAAKLGKGVNGFDHDALECVVRYPWPGNVRELENCIERAVAMARFDHLVVDDLPERVRTVRDPPIDPTLGVASNELVTMHELERRYVLHVLGLVKGNKARASRILGYDRRTLYRKLVRFGVRIDDGSHATHDESGVHRRIDLTDGDPTSDSRGTEPPLGFDAGSNGAAAVVLVVDDDPDTREMVRVLLESRGYDVRTASGLADAIGIRDVDVVLTDLFLTDGLGTSLVGRFGDAPVVAMSGASPDDYADAGFVDWVGKPIGLERLTSAVASAVGHHRALERASAPPIESVRSAV